MLNRCLLDHAYSLPQKSQDPNISSSDSDASSEDEEGEEEEGEEDDTEDPTGAKALIAESRKAAGDKARVERKAKRKAEKAESERLAEERRKKHVKLNKLTSISGCSGGGHAREEKRCYGCGQPGHERRDCPRSANQRSYGRQ